jgi:hypothetical protein
MTPTKLKQTAIAAAIVVLQLIRIPAASAQAAAPAKVMPVGAVVRRVVMKDAQSAEGFRQKLETMKATGIFRDQIQGIDPKKPVVIDVNFLVSGNFLLVIGSKDWVDSYIDAIRLMGYLFERPRAHLQLNLRVVQITGPANADVIQMSETVRALVDAQRDEVVRTFSDLDEYLTHRTQLRTAEERKILDAARILLPSLGTGQRPMTVPEILILLMLDRSSPAPQAVGIVGTQMAAEDALQALPNALELVLRNPKIPDAAALKEVQDELGAWKKAVNGAKAWCGHYAAELDKSKDNSVIGLVKSALQQPDTPIPSWLARRLLRSIDTTERLYPNLVRSHTERSLRELDRRFGLALERAAKVEQAVTKGEDLSADEAKKAEEKAKKNDPKLVAMIAGSPIRRSLLALKNLADELVPAPMALFESVANAAENGAPTADQLVQMLVDYAAERKKLEAKLQDETLPIEVNYLKLQALESSLNLWLRRVAESMARSLEQQFYRRYADELRLLANRELSKGSNRSIIEESNIDQVPDVTRDVLLADTGVNIFLSNSISLQFAPEAMNTVSAQVQSSLPSKQSLIDRIQQASTAATSLTALQQAFGIDGTAMVKALLAGGQAVPVQGGINLSAMPTIGFDASTVTLNLTANQTLAPNTDKVADRVTNHSINSATVTALTYEPMVLSTLTSNLSYYEKGGGVPILRKIPGVKEILGDVPLPGFKETNRLKGVFQSSVLILEPVVIPTIEDLVRYNSGFQQAGAGPGVTVTVKEDGAGTPVGGNPLAGVPSTVQVPAAPAPAAPAAPVKK